MSSKSLVLLSQLTTELQQQINSSEKLQSEFDLFFDTCPIMLCIASLDGYFKKVNKTFSTTLGYSIEELTTTPYMQFVYHKDKLQTVGEATAVAHGVVSYTFINRYVAKNGDIKWLDWRSTLNEKTGLIYACARDVTATKEYDERFAFAFDSSPIGVALVDPEGRWIKVNPSICNIVGYSESELLRTNFQAMTFPADLPPDLKLMEKTLNGDIDSYELKKRYVRKTGETVAVKINVNLVRGAADEPKYFVVHIMPV